MEDKLDSVIGMAVAAVVGVVLLCAFVIPTCTDFIGDLTGENAQYAPLLGLVVLMCIIGLIVGVIRYFQR